MNHNPFLIRVHRIIPQLAFMVLLTYFYGWTALLLVLLILCMEIPLSKFDAWVNPWFRKYKAYMDKICSDEVVGRIDPLTEKRIASILNDFDDGLDDNCPNCRREYSDKDRDYQMCHHCGHDNSLKF